MVHSDDEDFEEMNERLIAENTHLKEALEATKKKHESAEGEVKTLLRKVVKLLEETVEKLQEDLRKYVRIEGDG